MDRISELPEPILHHILCFLPTKEAFRTCVLSKSWRHLGSTRPKFEFCEEDFHGRSERVGQDFQSVMEKALQRYHDQNLCIQEFCLDMSVFIGKRFRFKDSEWKSFLEKWFPMVFESDSIRKICLEGSQIIPIDGLHFKHLEILELKDVLIGDGDEDDADEDEDVYKPLLFRNVVDSEYNLKYLYLHNIKLSAELFRSLSLSFPSLETLHLLRCFGFEEIRLSSGSIKHLRMEGMVDGPVKKAVIDAPSLVLFEYEGDFPNNICFKATTGGWKSKIVVRSFEKFSYDVSSWCLKIYGFLQALSESEISIEICQDLGWDHEDKQVVYESDIEEVEGVDESDDEEVEWVVESESDDEEVEVVDDSGIEEVESDANYDGFFYGPVAVERLHLNLIGHSMTSSSDLIINLFRLCHPRNIDQFWYFDPQSGYEKQENQIVKFMSKALLLERERKDYIWQQDLMEVSMERVSDDEDRDEVCVRIKWKLS